MKHSLFRRPAGPVLAALLLSGCSVVRPDVDPVLRRLECGFRCPETQYVDTVIRRDGRVIILIRKRRAPVFRCMPGAYPLPPVPPAPSPPVLYAPYWGPDQPPGPDNVP